MATRLTAKIPLTAPSVLRSLLFTTLSSSPPFNPPPLSAADETNKRPQADPSTNLFISGLSKRTTSDGLREFASKFGEVVSARVVTDRASGYSKGFGFVNYVSLEDAAGGIKGMDGQFLDGWVIFAEYAKPRPEFPQRQEFPQNNSAPFPNRRY